MKVILIAMKEPHMTFGQVGLEIMAVLLKEAGHEVHGMVESTFDTSEYITRDEKKKLKLLDEIQPDLVGFSVLTMRYQWCLKFAKMIKDSYPEVIIVFGGPHPTALPEIVIKESCVDVVCVGEGEFAMLELCEKPKRKDIRNLWFKRGSIVVQNPLRLLIEDLDALPFADKALWLESVDKGEFKRYLTMITRGCPYSCAYCANSQVRELCKGLGPYVRTRSVDNVILELVEAKKKHNLNWVVFMDDNLTLNKQWFEEFVPKYKKYVNVPYASNTHPLTIDRDRAQWLKESNCAFIMLGLQSGSEKIRKMINRHETNDDIRRVASICHEVGLNFTIDHIFGLTNPESEYLKESALLYNELRPSQINTFFLYYFPRTPIVGMRDFTDEELHQIEQGTYQPPTFRTSRERGPLGYRNLFTVLPLLPKWVVKWVVEKGHVFWFRWIPESVIWAIKIFNSLRIGNTPSLIAHLKFLPHKIRERLRGYKGEFD